MQRSKKDKRIQLRVDVELHAAVTTMAYKQGKTVSGLIEEYLQQWVKSQRPSLDDMGVEQA